MAMDNNKIVLISITQDELQNLISNAVKEALEIKKPMELMSFSECREFLGVSASALNAWKAANKIPYHRIGKRILFKREEVIGSLKESNYSKLRGLE